MKKLSMLIVALVATMTAWAQQETSASNTKVNTDFSKYQTFTWANSDPTVVGPTGYDIYYYEITPATPGKMDPADSAGNRPSMGNKPSGHTYSYNVIIPAADDATNTVIRDGISNELIGRGYRENDGGADLIVAYQVFDQKATLHGYIDDATAGATGTPPTQTRDVSDTATFVLEPGTLMISLIDAETSEMVWNGFSSGLIDDRAFMADENELKEAIHTIFEKFQHTADHAKRD
jgi:hypothetical protein